MQTIKIRLLLLPILSFVIFGFTQWGFFGHKKINELAVYSLPEEMLVFYKKHIDFIRDNAVNPDKRRYAVPGEEFNHYIDLDHYGALDSVKVNLPKHWKEACEKFGEDSITPFGIAPWHVQKVYYQLENAFLINDPDNVLRLSADLGHYVGDCHVPLHTTQNYNGQLTNQHGIHGLWESRLPELFSNEYELLIGKAAYIDNIANSIWEVIYDSHAAVDSVLSLEKNLSQTLPKYSTDIRNGRQIETVSQEYSKAYHIALNQMVEKRMTLSIKFVTNLWYTAWVNAGQPDLSTWNIDEKQLTEKFSDTSKVIGRKHEH